MEEKGIIFSKKRILSIFRLKIGLSGALKLKYAIKMANFCNFTSKFKLNSLSPHKIRFRVSGFETSSIFMAR